MAGKEKQKILIVDDSEMNRLILSDILEEEFEILEAEDGEEGIMILQKRNMEISLVLLDIVMPGMDGFGVLEVMNQNRWIKDTDYAIGCITVFCGEVRLIDNIKYKG